MTRLLAATGILTTFLVISALHASLARAEVAEQPVPSLAGVTWDGSAADLSALRGKTVVVLTYVTWCPICNGWAPDMLSQLSQAIEGKPVVVLAVATDVGPQEAKQYLVNKKFVGPNIFYGSDANLATAFGFENKFFNYVILNPEGQIAFKGDAGGCYDKAGGKQYVAPLDLAKQKDLGKFQFISTDMSPDLKDALWPIELGVESPNQQHLKKIEKSVSGEDRARLKKTIDGFMEAELENGAKLAVGAVDDRLLALDKASQLATNFKATPAGVEAKKILADLNKDKSLKKEAAAKQAFEHALQSGDPQRRTQMQAVAKRFPDTFYGQQAAKTDQPTAK